MPKISQKDILSRLLDSRTRDLAFAQLISQYKEPLYWHVRGIVLIHEDADDVVQNTFIKIFKNLHKFKGQSKLYTWMFRIATNEALTHLKKSKKHKAQSLNDECNELSNTELTADPHFNGEHAKAMLTQIIITLPLRQRTVFNMRYFQDMKFKDIAEILELSLGGVKSSYHIAQKKIKNHVVNKTF